MGCLEFSNQLKFSQFLYDSVERVLFKADFFFFFCMTEMQRQTLAHNLNIQMYNTLTYIMP